MYLNKKLARTALLNSKTNFIYMTRDMTFSFKYYFTTCFEHRHIFIQGNCMSDLVVKCDPFI